MKTICALIATNSPLSSLKETIKSISSQTRKIDKLVIVNDVGNYQILDLEKILIKSNIPYKLINNKSNKGLTKSLNIGLKYCTEDYIARADSGDIWHPDKIKLQEELLNRNNDIICVGNQCGYFVEDINKIISESNFPTSSQEIIQTADSIGLGIASHSSIFIRSKYLKYDNLYKRSQDLDLYLRLISSKKKLFNINKVLSYVYFDPKGISINQKPSQLRYIYRCYHNFQCRNNKLKENKNIIKEFSIFDYLWLLAKPFYKIYLKLDIEKNKSIKFLLLSICLVIYPPLIPFYLFRINFLKRLRLFLYSMM